MARPALSATRGLDIIDFMGAFPARAFSLSEIARATKINVASCHAVLNALTERGYLARAPEQRGYTLGPVLIAAGHAALRAQPLIARTIEAADALFAELQVPVSITKIVEDEVVCLHSRAFGGRDAGMAAGHRRPLVPPIGGTFFAWGSEEEIGRWFARHDPPADAAMIAAWRHTLDLTRQRGAQVTLRRSEDSAAVSALMAELAAGGGVPEYKDAVTRLFNSFEDDLSQPETIEPERLYDIILIAAPVFDAGGRVAFSLCLGGFAEALSGATILAHVDRLVRTCLRVVREDRIQG